MTRHSTYLSRAATTLAAATVLMSAGLVGCGDPAEDAELAESSSPIIKGDVTPEESPFVRLTLGDLGSCSGVLLDAHHVLTASHCMRDGTISIGSTGILNKHTGDNFDSFWSQWNYTAGYIVGMASHGGKVYAWYKSGMAIAGGIDDPAHQLTGVKRPFSYTLPGGRTPSQVVAMGISNGGNVYAWYSDGYVSRGTISDLGASKAPYRYTLASGKTPQDIVGIAISNNNHVVAWYRDNTVSKGTTSNLDSLKTYTWSQSGQRSTGQIIDMAINKATNQVYTYYNNGVSNSPGKITVHAKAWLESGGTRVNKSPSGDLAIVRTAYDFPEPDSAVAGHTWPTRSNISAKNTVGKQLECFGYGRNTLWGGAGTLRKGDQIPVTGTGDYPWTAEADDELIIEPSWDGQIHYEADSGGGCFLRTTGGDLVHVGTISWSQDNGVNLNFARAIVRGGLVSTHTHRIWITNTLTNN